MPCHTLAAFVKTLLHVTVSMTITRTNNEVATEKFAGEIESQIAQLKDYSARIVERSNC